MAAKVPAKSLNQLILMQEDLKRLERGEPTRTGMTRDQLLEFTNTPWQGLPTKVKQPKKAKR